MTSTRRRTPANAGDALDRSGAVPRVVGWAVIAGAVAYSWLTAGTTPFTLGADVVTAVPLVLAAAAVPVVRVRRRRRTTVARRAGTGGVAVADDDTTPGQPAARLFLPWVVLAVVVAGWELFNLFSGGRTTHPTFSSLYDSLARWRGAKAVVFFCWLALGAWIVRA